MNGNFMNAKSQRAYRKRREGMLSSAVRMLLCVLPVVLLGILCVFLPVQNASASEGSSEELISIPVCFTVIFTVILVALAVAILLFLKSLLLDKKKKHNSG